MCNDIQSKAVVTEAQGGNRIRLVIVLDHAEIKGIKGFWLKALQRVYIFDEMIKERDIDIMKYLIDIKYVLHVNEKPVSCTSPITVSKGIYSRIPLCSERLFHKFGSH